MMDRVLGPVESALQIACEVLDAVRGTGNSNLYHENRIRRGLIARCENTTCLEDKRIVAAVKLNGIVWRCGRR